MSEKRITSDDMEFAQVLGWNLYDANGRQIMRDGDMLVDAGQLAALIEAGVFAHAPPSGLGGLVEGDEAEESPFAEISSVLEAINDCSTRLEQLLLDLSAAKKPEQQLRAIATHLQAAVVKERNIALASIYLKQISGVYAIRHCIETAIIALIIARGHGMAEQDCSSIVCAALTMNVGMLDIHEQLQTRNALSSEEKQAIHHHPERSLAILQVAGIRDIHWLDCVLHHHEVEDGSGYPYGLEEKQVPYNARMLAMCDRYCAQVSARNYRRSLRPDVALQGLQTPNEQDAQIWQIFAKEIGRYPAGSYVRLANGETGVVAQQTADALQIHALLDANEHSIITQTQLRDSRSAEFAILHSVHEDELDMRFHMKQIWGELAAD